MLNNLKKYGLPVLLLAVVVGVSVLFVQWTINRVYVPEGCSMVLRYKGPLPFVPGKRRYAKEGHFAVVDKDGHQEIGILADLKGPGRHFYCPIWWERTIFDHEGLGRGDNPSDTNVMLVRPGQVAVVRSAVGDDLPEGEYLVDGELGETNNKGILRKVYGPGIYRAHPYAYQFTIVGEEVEDKGGQVKHSGWVEIPTGYVGVVTNKANIPAKKLTKGIQKNVLPPGLYPINGKEQEIDIVEIGYRETTVRVVNKTDKAGKVLKSDSGEPLIADGSSGIDFPSSDGFEIYMDFTAIWGVMPDQAASIISRFGNVDAIENRVILPQIESIGRNKGSSYSAKQLLVGTDRAVFQKSISDKFRTVLEGKSLTLSEGLVRAVYIPQEVLKPIQDKYVADENKITREQQQETALEEAKLRDAEQEVALERQVVESQTDVLVGDELAAGDKEVGEIQADTRKLVAEIDKKTAMLEAQAEILLGQASADAKKMKAEAEAGKFKLAVAAFGSPLAYNKYIFASQLPESVKLNFMYAGEGTLWTDLNKAGKGIQPTIPLRQAPENK